MYILNLGVKGPTYAKEGAEFLNCSTLDSKLQGPVKTAFDIIGKLAMQQLA